MIYSQTCQSKLAKTLYQKIRWCTNTTPWLVLRSISLIFVCSFIVIVFFSPFYEDFKKFSFQIDQVLYTERRIFLYLYALTKIGWNNASMNSRRYCLLSDSFGWKITQMDWTKTESATTLFCQSKLTFSLFFQTTVLHKSLVFQF